MISCKRGLQGCTFHEEERMSERGGTSWLFWPFTALWRMVTWILAFTGRILAIVLGLTFLIVGFLLKVTVVGAILGVPMLLFGLLLILRGLF